MASARTHWHIPALLKVHLLGFLIDKPQLCVRQCINETKEPGVKPHKWAARQRGHRRSDSYTNTCHRSKLGVINIPLNKGEGTSGYPAHSHKHIYTHTLQEGIQYCPFSTGQTPLFGWQRHSIYIPPQFPWQCVCVYLCVRFYIPTWVKVNTVSNFSLKLAKTNS